MGFDEQHDPQLPPQLARALGELYSTPAVGARVDEAILNRARARFAGVRRMRPVLRVASLAAAAAIVLITFAVVVNRPDRAVQVANQQDLNADGIVDIRDALYLAHHLEGAKTQWDFNHDGRVDRQDADAIASTAVSLKGGTR
jgi:hypothetical protein